MMDPLIDEAAEEYAGRLTTAKHDIDHHPQTAPEYDVQGVPTFLLFRADRTAATRVGLMTKGILRSSSTPTSERPGRVWAVATSGRCPHATTNGSIVTPCPARPGSPASGSLPDWAASSRPPEPRSDQPVRGMRATRLLYVSGMVTGKVSENAESRFSALLVGAARLPGVRIDREAYLRTALARHCSEDELRRAVEATPAAAGIPLAVLDSVANESIRYETAKVSAVSAAAGIPGFMALPATVPADMAQYVAHMLRIAQKLAYLYSWPDLFSAEHDDIDDATKGVLTLFFGVMFGTQSANAGVGKVAGMMSEQAAKKLPQKALTKGVVYPIVKKVANYLGVEMTKQTFAKSVSKAIPLVGAAVSGGLTFATFRPMARRLKTHLSGLELAEPVGQVVPGEVVRDEVSLTADGAKIPQPNRGRRVLKRW